MMSLPYLTKPEKNCLRKALSFILAISILCTVSVQSGAASVSIVNAQPEKRAVPSDRSILEAASATKAETHSDDSDGQSAPTGTQTQNPPAHHSHHVRNFIIIFALGAALLIGLAAAAK
jgi:Na+-transporting NADH:ubiquinone oxidoreductase subunit NqrC